MNGREWTHRSFLLPLCFHGRLTQDSAGGKAGEMRRQPSNHGGALTLSAANLMRRKAS